MVGTEKTPSTAYRTQHKPSKIVKGITNPYSPRRRAMLSHAPTSLAMLVQKLMPLLSVYSLIIRRPPHQNALTQIAITVITTTKNDMITESRPGQIKAGRSSSRLSKYPR